MLISICEWWSAIFLYIITSEFAQVNQVVKVWGQNEKSEAGRERKDEEDGSWVDLKLFWMHSRFPTGDVKVLSIFSPPPPAPLCILPFLGDNVGLNEDSQKFLVRWVGLVKR